MLNFIFDYVYKLENVWQIIIFIISLILGLFILIKGADLFVDKASLLAKKIKIPSMIIGLTIVACGTSAPEASVSIVSALNSSPELSVGNVVGSNIFNLLIVLGVSLLFSKIIIDRKFLKKDLSFMIITSILLLVFSFFFGASHALILIEGIILTIVFITYIVINIISAKRNPIQDETMNEIDSNNKKSQNLFICIVLLIIGLLAIIVGGELVTFGAKNISLQIGISENLVGLTIVAAGTSLPELMTSVVAAKKGEKDIALGNVIGSNIFNVAAILGLSAIIVPTPISLNNLIDIVIMCFIFIGFVIYILFKKELHKKDGIIMLGIYAVYLTYIIVRDFAIL